VRSISLLRRLSCASDCEVPLGFARCLRIDLTGILNMFRLRKGVMNVWIDLDLGGHDHGVGKLVKLESHQWLWKFK
jgi:D-serine deaminase-like pyridoxal phosphate-dependent protein